MSTNEQLAQALRDDLEEAAALVSFLSDHLYGRMGEGALDDMRTKAESWRETLAANKAKKAAPAAPVAVPLTDEKIDELRRMLADYQRECEACFNIAQRLDALNPELAGAFTGTPSERIGRQMIARGIGVKLEGGE